MFSESARSLSGIAILSAHGDGIKRSQSRPKNKAVRIKIVRFSVQIIGTGSGKRVEESVESVNSDPDRFGKRSAINKKATGEKYVAGGFVIGLAFSQDSSGVTRVIYLKHQKLLAQNPPEAFTQFCWIR
jgi:hypothetical protein